MELVWKIFLAALLGLILFSAYLYVMQASMIYFPDMPGRNLVATPQGIGLEFEEVRLDTADGIRIHGWFGPASRRHRSGKPATVLFFHGNAGNISQRLDSIRLFHDLNLNVFIIDYRGYGLSTGKPDEAGTYEDAETAWQYLTRSRGIAPDAIIVFGRSLGGAIAAWLASHHQPAALIVESSFVSVSSMARRLYPFLPVRLLSRFGYNTRDHVKSVTCPVLVAHSPDDEIIPYQEGRDIFAAAPEPRYFLQMQGGHNDGFIVSGARYVDGLRTFIDSSLQPASSDASGDRPSGPS